MIKEVLVVGAGTMGHGIALVSAMAGYDVVLMDVSEEMVTTGYQKIDKVLSRDVEKERITAAVKAETMDRIRISTNLEEGSTADIVIEAVQEDEDIKKALFGQLEGMVREDCLFVSNTSAISISNLAAATGRPDKVMGMHFFNPVPLMKLVELIRGRETSQATFDTIRNFAQALGKTPVDVKESPGFVVNRLLLPFINEAAYLVMEKVSSPEEIDTAMKLGANHPIGPLALADLIGIDVCLSVLEYLHQELDRKKHEPCPLLQRMVEENKLGRKTGQGFYTY